MRCGKYHVRWYVLRTTQNGESALLPLGVSRPAGTAGPVRVVVSSFCSRLMSCKRALLVDFHHDSCDRTQAVSVKTVISIVPSSTSSVLLTRGESTPLAKFNFMLSKAPSTNYVSASNVISSFDTSILIVRFKIFSSFLSFAPNRTTKFSNLPNSSGSHSSSVCIARGAHVDFYVPRVA